MKFTAMKAQQDVAVREFGGSQAENLLKSTLSSIDIGVFLTDLDHVALACNSRFGQIWGIDHQEVVHSDYVSVRQMVENRVADLKAWEENLTAVYDDPWHIQTDEQVLKNPHMVVRRYTGPVRGDNGELVGRIWTFLDITAEVRHRRMREVLEAASILTGPDPKSIYQKITQMIFEFYGSLTLLSITNQDYLEFRAVGAPPGHPAFEMAGNQLADSYCQFCLAADRPYIVQDARKEPDKSSLLPASMGLTRYAGVPVISPNGQVLGTLCIMDERSDEPIDNEDLKFLSQLAMRISGELERERQLQNLRDELDLTSQELKDVQNRVIEGEKLATAGTLAASIAHDIRNILSALTLEISMGAEKPQETLDTVKTHLERFSILAHRLLAYAKPKRIAQEIVSIPECLNRVLILLRNHLIVGKIELIAEIDESIPRIQADSGRLDHLFVNLILNALQAMKTGGRLTVSCRQTDDCAVIEIKDTGAGISKHQLATLFEPFNSSRQDGFGLGLYSCRQIASECSGSIEVDSTPQVGTTFRVRIPLK